MIDNNLQNNKNSNDQQQVEQNVGFDDLRLTAEELDGIKGGCGPFHKDEPQPSFTIWLNNHNETVMSDEGNDQNAISDLEVPNADEVKGGPIFMEYEGIKGRV